jgi:hypothetical protein
MSVEMNREPAQSNEHERREAQGERVPFEGIVEVGGALGPSFEALAVDVSADGIHLRTAYLPELGQPLTCRIELNGDVVLAAGEVVWRQEAERGGEFGLRFTDLDAASEVALRKLVNVEPTFDAKITGTKVRLHIEGLNAPMRARIRGSAAEGLTVGSELGFLQVGKELELEDAVTGGKRAARIDRVEVEVNPETHIPQLVVSLRYDVADTDIPVEAAPVHPSQSSGGPDDTPEPSVIDDEKPRATMRASTRAPADAVSRSTSRASRELETDEDPFGPMRSGLGEALHRASAKMGPALARLGAQAKTTFGLVADRAKKAASKTDDVAAPTRRTTAPAPTGGLHASGRKVVRTDTVSAMDALDEKPRAPIAKRRIAIGSAVMVAGILALAAVHKPAPTALTTPATDPATSAPALGAAAPPAPVVSALPAASVAPFPTTSPALAPVPPEEPSVAPSQQANEDSHPRKKALRVTPFGNGAVGHANVLHLKMDGPIEKIEGATTPTGFNVVIPDRRSLEAAAPLAARDSRIAAIRITNEANGAELSLSFKDGVPNYQVRAKGDSLEILLAPQGKLSDADDAPAKSTKHTKHTKH